MSLFLARSDCVSGLSPFFLLVLDCRVQTPWPAQKWEGSTMTLWLLVLD